MRQLPPGLPITAEGDLIIGNATAIPIRLATGASGTVLVGGAQPSYTANPTIAGNLTVQGATALAAASLSNTLTLASTGVAAKTERGDHILATKAPRLVSINEGTTAAPVTTAGPLVKISKHENILVSQMTNAATNEENAALGVLSYGALASEVQVCAGHFFAHGGGTVTGADVAAVNGTAWLNNSGATGYAGNYLHGRRNYDTGGAYAVELRGTNQTLTDAPYDPNSASKMMGAWATAGGTAQNSGAFICASLTTAPDAKWHVGFAAIAGSVTDQTFRDDSSSTTSIDINGSHTVGVDLSGATLSSAALYVPNNVPITYRNAANSGDVPALQLDTLDRVNIRSGVLTVSSVGAVISGNTLTGSRAADDVTGFGLTLFRSRASNAALQVSDVISDIEFQGRNATPATFTFNRIRSSVQTVTAGNENGLLRFYTAAAGTLTERMKIGGTGMSFFGVAEVVRQTIGGGATDPATTQTLANNIRTALINLGLCQA